ncbi:D-alanyl-D-alanine carboxypeptidase family protein [Salinibacillus xinjiangensis]|uniref:D-alanyl-D-alanine carboxypeptidase n=1 Tax=Salinibacillus xinjiangensis TaxID=1229268 RepID=A0A6G1X7I3_9BACI|nr:D-alanyl-D-alanine carboxypeptidase family protein [Salinibacillus xinjiangensis]MRG86865.1 D-alanyl-D-alanine carboxypeptidase [Salinibacillus xinjiangensis]
MKNFLIYILTITLMFILFVPRAFASTEDSPPTITSQAAIVMDAKTGAVIYEKNAENQLYPASLTKIATAIFAIETGNLNDVVTVSEEAVDVEGTLVYLDEGEQVTLKKLVQGLLINSGNDAGAAIAEHLSGSVEQFAIDINQYLQNKVGVKNTHFENPHGLFNPEHVTTAKDLAVITQYAMKNETFREIFGTEVLPWKGETWDTTLYTHHKLMRENPYEGITGGKTGFVNESGHTLATTATRDNLSLIVVTLKNQNKMNAYKDTENLLDYGFDNFETSSLEGGTVIQVNNHGYRLPDKVYYTHSSNEDHVEKQLAKNGTLKLVAQDGELTSSVELKPVEKKSSQTQKINSSGGVASNLDYISLSFVFGSLLIVLGLAVMIYKKRKNRKNPYYLGF